MIRILWPGSQEAKREHGTVDPIQFCPALAAQAVGLLVIAVIGYLIWQTMRPQNGEAGIASGNGRIEATEINIATKIPGRLADITVFEGDFVCTGQVLATGSPAALLKCTGTQSLEAAFIALLPQDKRADYRPITIPPAQDGSEVDIAIEAKDLTMRFGDFTAVDHVSFRIRHGRPPTASSPCAGC